MLEKHLRDHPDHVDLTHVNILAELYMERVGGWGKLLPVVLPGGWESGGRSAAVRQSSAGGNQEHLLRRAIVRWAVKQAGLLRPRGEGRGEVWVRRE